VGHSVVSEKRSKYKQLSGVLIAYAVRAVSFVLPRRILHGFLLLPVATMIATQVKTAAVTGPLVIRPLKPFHGGSFAKQRPSAYVTKIYRSGRDGVPMEPAVLGPALNLRTYKAGTMPS